jgi:hypothetical protein
VDKGEADGRHELDELVEDGALFGLDELGVDLCGRGVGIITV